MGFLTSTSFKLASDKGLMGRYFDPAEDVLPEQIITGVGCSAGMFCLAASDEMLTVSQFLISYFIP